MKSWTPFILLIIAGFGANAQCEDIWTTSENPRSGTIMSEWVTSGMTDDGVEYSMTIRPTTSNRVITEFDFDLPVNGKFKFVLLFADRTAANIKERSFYGYRKGDHIADIIFQAATMERAGRGTSNEDKKVYQDLRTKRLEGVRVYQRKAKRKTDAVFNIVFDEQTSIEIQRAFECSLEWFDDSKKKKMRPIGVVN